MHVVAIWMMPEKYGTITILRIQGSAIKLLGTLLVFSFSLVSIIQFIFSIHFRFSFFSRQTATTFNR